MNAVAPPARWADATNSNAARALTLAAAGLGVVPRLVSADVTRLNTLCSAENADLRTRFQGAFSGCRVRSQRGGGMSGELFFTNQLGSSMRRRVDIAVHAKSGGRCWYCGKQCELPPMLFWERMTIDHLVPQRQGGGHGLDNLVPACFSCNSAKGARTVEEWRWSRLRAASGVPSFSDKQRAWLASFGVEFELCMGPGEPFWFEREGLEP